MSAGECDDTTRFGCDKVSEASWGPESRRAAVSVTFETLAAGPDAQPAAVTPALPTVLDVLAERELSATFFVGAEIPNLESAALTLIASGWNEIAALGSAGDHRAVLEALSKAGRPAVGLRAPSMPAAWRAPDALRYLSIPAGTIAAARAEIVAAEHADMIVDAHSQRLRAAAGLRISADRGPLLIPHDRMLSDAAFLAPELIGANTARPGGVRALHEALQVAIADALQRREQLTLTFFPGLIDRADTLAVLLETLDLLHGLARAERLWLPTLAQLASWWAGG